VTLRIASFTVTPCGGRLRSGVGHRHWLQRRGVVLALRDERGTVGLGEAAPLEPDELSRVRAALPLVLARMPPVELEEAPRTAVADALVVALGELSLPPSGVWALETALFDLLGQRLGMSIAACLRGTQPAYDDVEVSGLLGPLEAGRALAEAEELTRRGIRVMKAKIGADDDTFGETLARLSDVRRAHPNARLRLDANGAWSVPRARQRLEDLACLEPELCEQPTEPEQLDQLGVTPVPWFADESLDAGRDSNAVMDIPGLSGVVIKPPRVGGMLAAVEIAEAARKRRLPVIVTHCFDGAIGLAAACEVALGLAERPMACGLDRHAALEVFPPAEILQRRVENRVLPTGRHGLGLALSC